MDTTLTRRSLFKYSAAGAAVIGVGSAVPLGQSASTATASLMPEEKLPRPFTRPFVRPQVLRGVDMVHPTEGPYKLFEITQQQGVANIVPGFNTPIFGYNGSVPGPIVKVDQGTKVKLRIKNLLPAVNPLNAKEFWTSTHLHGSASLPQYDGYADDITRVGHYKDYWYPNWQGARTLWYHDHGVHNTAHNAYAGLAAQYHISDATEKALLPQGEYDVPLTVSDIQFNADGTVMYDDHDHSGLWGDVILVNGVPWPVLQVKRRVYCFRCLNASLGRSYNFRLFNVTRNAAVPVHMVATDGGLMPRSVQTANWRQSMGERYEFLVDFRNVATGDRIEMRNTSNANNIDYTNTGKVMRFDVAGDIDTANPADTLNNTIPTTLYTHEVMGSLGVSASTRASLNLRLQRSDLTNVWSINGRTWEDVRRGGFQEVVANPKEDEVQVWQFENSSGGWFHPMHVHLADFRILSRTRGVNRVQPYEQGPKDTVYVGESETVKIAVKFRLNPDNSGSGSVNSGSGQILRKNEGGRYMIHCHNLPHEDHDMMVQFAVGDRNVNNPVTTDPAKPIPASGVYDDGTPA